MNKERLTKLADFIEKHPELPFNMAKAVKPEPHNCGTAGCIAGFAVALWPSLATELGANAVGQMLYTWDDAQMQNWLDIDINSQDKLFYPADSGIDWTDAPNADYDNIFYSDVTRAGAVKTLRRFAETGKVEWYKWEQQ